MQEALHAGIAAARAGDHETARAHLLTVVKHEPQHETAWLWLSHVMPTLEQSLLCIDQLLTINPQHSRAREAREVLQIRLMLEESALLTDRSATHEAVSTPERRYLLGEALVEARVITPHQLEQALAEQRRLQARRKSMRLGDVLLRMKLVSRTQLEAAVAAQVEPRLSANDESALGRLGDYLLRRGLVTRAQLHQALAQQNELQRKRKPALLGHVLVNSGYIRAEDLNRALLDWRTEYNSSFV